MSWIYLDDSGPLREWMEKHYGELRDDIGTAEYALQFLKASHENLLASQNTVSELLKNIQQLKDRVEKS